MKEVSHPRGHRGSGGGDGGGGVFEKDFKEDSPLSQSLCHELKHSSDNISQVPALFVEYFSLLKMSCGNNDFRNIFFFVLRLNISDG